MTPGELPLCLINSVPHLPCFVLFYCFRVVTTPWHPIQHPFLFHYPALKLPIRAHGCGVRNRESLEPLKRDGDLQKGRGLGSNRKDQRAEGKTPCRQRKKQKRRGARSLLPFRSTCLTMALVWQTPTASLIAPSSSTAQHANPVPRKPDTFHFYPPTAWSLEFRHRQLQHSPLDVVFAFSVSPLPFAVVLLCVQSLYQPP